MMQERERQLVQAHQQQQQVSEQDRLKAQADEQLIHQTVDEMTVEYPEMTQLLPEMMELQGALGIPDSSLAANPREVLGGLFRAVVNDHNSQFYATNAKQQAQTLSGAGNRVASPSGDEAEWARVQAAGDSGYRGPA